MNNEIKEILDFKEDADYKRLSVDEITILRDYITKLQEENERLKELCDKYEEEHSTAFNLWKTNIIENVPAFSDIQEQLEDYKSRNEKAIAYIECGKILLEILQGSEKK